jgi:hypothetical protein
VSAQVSFALIHQQWMNNNNTSAPPPAMEGTASFVSSGDQQGAFAPQQWMNNMFY